MSKKSKKKNKIEDLWIELGEENAVLMGPAEAGKEAIPSESNLQEKESTSEPDTDEQISSDVNESRSSDETVSESSAEQVDEVSADDLLEDVRRSLIEDESQKDSKRPKWWNRLAKGLRKDKDAATGIPGIEEDVPSPPEETVVNLEEVREEAKASEDYLDEIDDLIDMLETDSDAGAVTTNEAVETPPEPEKIVDLDELKKQAFQHRPSDSDPEKYSEVRSIALGGDEEVFVEVESKAQNPLEERIGAIENALKPFRRYINFALAFLGVVIAVISLMILYDLYLQNRPEPPVVEQEVILPFPTSIVLPGDLNFKLGKGTLEDGEWNPSGPEWLEGTEICRWVSIPWSRQLEAVVRTFTQDDEIELLMSNNDRIVYKVFSIRQLTIADLQKLDSDSPCLLLVLAEADSEQRWVVTANP